MLLSYADANIFGWWLNHQLAPHQHELPQLKANNLLVGSVETLSQTGYRHCFGLAPDETLLSLTKVPAANALAQAGQRPHVLLFQHGYAESMMTPWDSTQPDADTRHSYFAPVLMNELNIGDVPYLCMMETGCAGFCFLLPCFCKG